MTYTSRFPQIELALVAEMELLARAVAEQVQQRAEERVPVDSGKLKRAIHVDRVGEADFSVVAGDNNVFYGHIVEHGGVRRGPRPFMLPAAEAVRAEIPKLARAALRSL